VIVFHDECVSTSTERNPPVSSPEIIMNDFVVGNQIHLARVGAKMNTVFVGCHESFGERQAA